MHQNIMN